MKQIIIIALLFVSTSVVAADYQNSSFPLSVDFPAAYQLNSFESESGLVTRVQTFTQDQIFRLDYSKPEKSLSKMKSKKILDQVKAELAKDVKILNETQVFAKGYEGKQWDYEFEKFGQKYKGVQQTFVNSKKWVTLSAESVQSDSNQFQTFLDSLNLK